LKGGITFDAQMQMVWTECVERKLQLSRKLDEVSPEIAHCTRKWAIVERTSIKRGGLTCGSCVHDWIDPF